MIYFCWVAFEFQFLPHLPCDIFRTNLETSGNMYFDFRKGLWVFIIALYYKSTHLQNSGRDHAQWHKPLGSTLIWLANIIVHCQSCQRRSQDSFVELKFLRLFEVLRVLKLVSSEVLSVNIQHQAYLRVQAEGGQQKMQLLACDSIPTYTPLNSSSSSISNVSKEINTSNLPYCFCLQWA